MKHNLVFGILFLIAVLAPVRAYTQAQKNRGEPVSRLRMVALILGTCSLLLAVDIWLAGFANVIESRNLLLMALIWSMPPCLLIILTALHPSEHINFDRIALVAGVVCSTLFTAIELNARLADAEASTHEVRVLAYPANHSLNRDSVGRYMPVLVTSWRSKGESELIFVPSATLSDRTATRLELGIRRGLFGYSHLEAARPLDCAACSM
jgi:hypothetical protein